MVEEPTIKFTARDFQLQFKIYFEELQRLLQEDPVCREQCEIVLYQDYQGQNVSFSQLLVDKVMALKRKECKVDGLSRQQHRNLSNIYIPKANILLL